MKPKFKIYPVEVNINSWAWRDQVDWILDNIGKYCEDWDYGEGKFWFTSKEEQLLYWLRWGCENHKTEEESEAV